ncbi:MAG: hypothetical protein ABWY18_13030 [Tardiphaga sp.]
MTSAASSDGVIEGDVHRFGMSRLSRCVLGIGAAVAAAMRLCLDVAAAEAGDLGPFEGFSFAVVLPVLLLGLTLSIRGDRSREGVLMRIGTACQLILIIAVPSLGLLLLLGLPVVFLLVELFETRVPARLRNLVSGFLVTC